MNKINKVYPHKFNFKERVENEAESTVMNHEEPIYRVGLAIEIYKSGSSKTVALICELLESDEAKKENHLLDRKEWADFISKHCK